MKAEAPRIPYLLSWPRHQYVILKTPGDSRRVRTLWQHGYRGRRWPVGGVFLAATGQRPTDRYNPTDSLREVLSAAQQAAAAGTAKAALAFVNRWGTLGVGIPDDETAEWDGVELTLEWLRRVRNWLEGYRDLTKGKKTNAAWASLRDVLAGAEMLGSVRHDVRASERGLQACFRLPTLLSAIAVGLWDTAVAGDRRLRRCPECSALFVPSRTNQEFCTRLCANRPTVRAAKRKRRLRERQELRMGATQGGKVTKS